MGIRGLTTFIREHFREWKQTDFKKWDHVIIDGNSVSLELYKQFFPWAFGGDLISFASKSKIFSRLLVSRTQSLYLMGFAEILITQKCVNVDWKHFNN